MLSMTYGVTRYDDYWCDRRRKWVKGAVRFRTAEIVCSNDVFDLADRIVNELSDMGYKFAGWFGDDDTSTGLFSVADRDEYSELMDDYKELKKRFREE